MGDCKQMHSKTDLSSNNVTIHSPPGKKGCGLRPLVPPLGGSERLPSNQSTLIPYFNAIAIPLKTIPSNHREFV